MPLPDKASQQFPSASVSCLSHDLHWPWKTPLAAKCCQSSMVQPALRQRSPPAALAPNTFVICVCTRARYMLTFTHTHILHTWLRLHIFQTFSSSPTCAHRHTYIHTYVRTYVRTYVHTYIRTLRTYIRTYAHTYIRTYVHTYIRTYIHT